MTDVIPMRRPQPEAERMIFVCGCGCSSFEVYSDGGVQCALCGDPQTKAGGAWDLPDRDATRPEGSEGRIRQVGGNGSTDFAKRVTMRRFQEDNTRFAVVLKDDGTIHCWGQIEGKDQLDWVERRLSFVREMMEPGL